MEPRLFLSITEIMYIAHCLKKVKTIENSLESIKGTYEYKNNEFILEKIENYLQKVEKGEAEQ